MSCFHPMIWIPFKHLDMLDPKVRERLAKEKEARDEYWNRFKHTDKKKPLNGVFVPRELLKNEQYSILLKEGGKPVPCGKCIGCKLDYSKQWADRCIHEAEGYDYNYFLTLTYDDDHLPVNKKGFPTLVKDEISTFMKRFREKMRKTYGHTGMRFFACGEYGSESFRPHYHIILFNCPLPDLSVRHPIKVDGVVKMIKQYDDDGNELLFSPLIASCWTDSDGQLKGTAQLGQVSYESCAYVARYVVKKQEEDDKRCFEKIGVPRPFLRMSRNPGIGESWFSERLERIYLYDNISFKSGDRVVIKKPPRYCDKLLLKKDEQKYYEIKAKRNETFRNKIRKIGYLGKDLVDMNHAQEAIKQSQIKALKRD